MSTDSSKRASTEDFEEKLAGPLSEVVPAGPKHDELYIDPAREAQLVRKLDMRIAPVMCAVFLLAYLDRSNIGNAAAAGLAETANLKGNQLNIAVSIFYIGYTVFELPGTVLMKKIRPSWFFSILMVAWGLTTLFSGFVNSFGSLMATRLLLGVFESPLFPGLTVYLSMFYKRAEQGRRVAYLFVASALSGAFGGLIAYGILRMDGVGGRAGWQWLYIIEGLITVLVGISLHWLLPDSPEVAWYLTAEDKELMALRYRQAQIYNGSQHFEWAKVKAALTDPRLYLSGTAQLCANVCSFGLSTFMPVIIRGLGFSAIKTQLITAPIYFWAAGVYIAVAIASDRIQRRSVFMVSMACVTLAGYAILVSPVNALPARIVGILLAATGVYCIVGLNITLLASSQAPYYKRASAIGLQQAIGNCAGFIASNIYVSTDAPRYETGAKVTISFISVAVVLYLVQWANFVRLNRKHKNLTTEERQRWLDEGRDGDAHPDFRFPQ